MATTDRRHDLDALRATAILLGVVLHAAGAYDLSAANWTVKDLDQHRAFNYLGAWIHGFRMPLFFVLSGFFAALLISSRGIQGFLRNRTLRLLVPLAICMVTLLPVQLVLTVFLGQINGVERLRTDAPERSLWAAAVQNDATAIRQHLNAGAAIDAHHDTIASSPLVLAATFGHETAVRTLIDAGAELDHANRDGTTALHAAVVLEHPSLVRVLVEAGADPHVVNGLGLTPRQALSGDPRYASMIAWLVGIRDPATEPQLKRAAARRQIETTLLKAEQNAKPRRHETQTGLALADLPHLPLLIHLWFLWVLFLFVLLLAGMTAACRWRFETLQPGHWLRRWMAAPRVWLWLLPVTGAAASLMSDGLFGPDGSASLIPRWHVFVFYLIFFGYGALYFVSRDSGQDQHKHWREQLLIATLVILPAGIAMSEGGAWRHHHAPERAQWIWAALNAMYAWLMIWGSMGLFGWLIRREHRWVRYLSDASYWIYIVHILPIISAGYLLAEFPWPAYGKFALVCLVTTLFALATYHWMVRPTVIGHVLGGPTRSKVLQS